MQLRYTSKDQQPKAKDTTALMRPKRAPIAAEAKNMTQKRPTARKKAEVPLAAPGRLNSRMVL